MLYIFYVSNGMLACARRPTALGFAREFLAVALSAPALACDKKLVTVIFKNLLDNARQYTENERAFVVLKTSGILVGNKGRIVRHAGVFCAASAAPVQAVRHPPAKGRAAGFSWPAGLRALELSRDCARPVG